MKPYRNHAHQRSCARHHQLNQGPLRPTQILSIHAQRFGVQLREAQQTHRIRTVELPPAAPGIVRAPRAMLRFVNADETGLVHGGLVQFELTFNGPDWLQGVPPATPGTPRPVPLTLTFGETTHTTTARLTARTVQAGKH